MEESGSCLFACLLACFNYCINLTRSTCNVDSICAAICVVRPLHEAVDSDHLELVRLLLSYGADVTLATYAGHTPLMRSNSEPMTRFLEAHIADMQGQAATLPWVFEGSASVMEPGKALSTDVCCFPVLLFIVLPLVCRLFGGYRSEHVGLQLVRRRFQ